MNVKTIWLLMLLLVMQQVAAAQYNNVNRRDSNRILNAKSVSFDLEERKKDNYPAALPFSQIYFTDVRYDTTFVALNWKLTGWNKTLNRKYTLNDGLAANLTRYVNRHYSSSPQSPGNELLCFIKKFSMTLHYEVLDHYNAGTELFNDASVHDINMEIECYYQSGDTLYPAMRIDTSYTHRFDNGDLFTEAVKEMIQPLLLKIENANLANIVKRKSYTPNAIAERYNNRFALPVLMTDVSKRGIYKSFAEFKNNNPSIDSFTIATDKFKYNAANANLIDATSLLNKAVQKRSTAVFLYNSHNEPINPSTIFGYSDGATFWIQHGALFYPLVRTGNSFEFVYSYHYADSNQHTQLLYILMPLNMETGLSH